MKRICLALALFSVLAGGARGQCMVGAAKREITPEVMEGRAVYLAGFGQNRTATGVHDPIWSRAFALSDGKRTVAIVVADLIGLFYEPDVLAIRAIVARELPDVHVIVASTHNHNGPDTMGLWGPVPLITGINPQYQDWMRKQTAKAVVEAVRSLRPAKIRVGSIVNQHLADLQGDGRIPIVKDPQLFVLQATDTESGKTIATFVQWSSHPETLGGSNRLLTADYCGVLCADLERRYGGVAVYANGAIGGLLGPLDIRIPVPNPRTGKQTPRRSFERVEALGLWLSKYATEALERGEPVTGNPRLELRVRQVYVPLQNERFRVLAAASIIDRPLYTDGRIDRRTQRRKLPFLGGVELPIARGRDLRTELNVLRFGPVEIVTVPGELYPELANGGYVRYPGADYPDAPFEPVIREHMTGKYKVLIGLGNDELGYIIPRCEWDNSPPWLNNQDHETYGEVNSCGVEVARIVTGTLRELLRSER